MTDLLSNPTVLLVWLALVAVSEAILIRDLATKNRHLMSLMKAVWVLTVLYSGPLGLFVYVWSGRGQISADTLLRRGFRSTAHCYAGCGMGEVAGLLIAAAVLSLGTAGTAMLTFTLAYLAGFGLTVGPLVQEGVPLGRAMTDAALSETPSIAVMEAVAIGVDLTLAGGAGPGTALFWNSMALSLSCGLLAAWPVNILLIRFGVKSGMMDPRSGASA